MTIDIVVYCLAALVGIFLILAAWLNGKRFK